MLTDRVVAPSSSVPLLWGMALWPADKVPSGLPPSSCQSSLRVQSPEQKCLVYIYNSANLPGWWVCSFSAVNVDNQTISFELRWRQIECRCLICTESFYWISCRSNNWPENFNELFISSNNHKISIYIFTSIFNENRIILWASFVCLFLYINDQPRISFLSFFLFSIIFSFYATNTAHITPLVNAL